MKATVRQFEIAYKSSLQECLAGAGEVALQHGYELGRQAVRDGLGVMDIISVHREAMLSLSSRAATAKECVQIVKASQDLLAECIAPFEFTHRGFLELESLNLKLEANEARYRLLSGTAGRLLGAEDPQAIVEDLCRDVMAQLDCQAFFNFLVDEQAGKLRLNACAGIPEEEVRKLTWLDYGVAVCGCAARDQVRIVAEDIFHTPDVRTELVKSYGIQAYCCHPLKAQNRLIGTLSFGTKTRPHFTSGEVELMRVVTEQVSIAMQRKQDEAFLKERTAQLEAANKELGGFTYTVSHDLRAPLRAIDGFSRMLLRDEEPRLEEGSKRKLNIIRENVQKMGQLIDDLLDFSRLGRQSLSLSAVDMKGLARQVWKECRAADPLRKMELKISTLPNAFADPGLVRQVLANLISNAVKFTKSREEALIEIGGKGEGRENVYYVRDNGIGFDMQYYDKLFGVFQRLHNDADYEGTGVGLAIVQRIIHRHGGRVWAEGKEGEGATFYFTLPGTAR